jgi:hypothetical protein
MDPISASSGAITLLVTASRSCKFIYDFLMEYSEASTRISKHCALLLALHDALKRLIELRESTQPSLQSRADFLDRIRVLLVEIREAEDSLSSLTGLIQQGRRDRILAKLKWVVSKDTKLRRFLDGLQPWLAFFLFEFGFIQMYTPLTLLPRHLQCCPSPDQSEADCCLTETKFGTSKSSTRLKFATALQNLERSLMTHQPHPTRP